jgi:hypothetical protein
MTIRSFAKRWLEFSAVNMAILAIILYFRHRPISREDLLGALAVVVGVGIGAALPGEHKAAKRLGFRLGQKLREYRRRNAES